MSANRPLEVHASQTPDSLAVTPNVSGVPADAALAETGRSGSVVDSYGDVPVGQATSPSGMTGRDADSYVDSVAGRGDSDRLDVAAVSPDSATPSVEGRRRSRLRIRIRRRACLRGCRWMRCGCGAAEVVAGGGLVEFVRGGVAVSPGGPVLLVAQGNPGAGAGAGAVVSPGQGSALAQGVGRDVVAVMPGQGGRGPQWMVFGADGSARPVGGSGGLVPGWGRSGYGRSGGFVGCGCGLWSGDGGRGETPAAQAGSVVGDAEPGATVRSATDTMRDTGGMPVRQWSAWDLRREIDGARQGGWSGDDELAAGWIVRGGYDPRTLVGPLVGDSAESSPSGVGWFGVEVRGEG
ncbi:hypothetical protein [Saccharopolyspora spinosa]|uniref:hypothetical protein n=1 Tax=Saccharopolyspora spinosa TaxID=60894 RepID=UPI00376F092A